MSDNEFWLTHFKFKKEDHWQVRMSAPSKMTKEAIKGNQYRDDFHVIDYKEYENLKAMADKMASVIHKLHQGICIQQGAKHNKELMEACGESYPLLNEYHKKFGGE